MRLGLNDEVMLQSTRRSKHYLINILFYLYPPMPVTAALGPAIEMEGVKFQRCVHLAQLENGGTITFIPPDGVLELIFRHISTHQAAHVGRYGFRKLAVFSM